MFRFKVLEIKVYFSVHRNAVDGRSPAVCLKLMRFGTSVPDTPK